MRKLAGLVVSVIVALVEHWLGETITVAVLSCCMLIFAGIVWRRASLLMAAPRANNCTKSYEIEGRLDNYVTIMAALAPIVQANDAATLVQLAPLLPIAQAGNAAFLSLLTQLPSQTASNSFITNSNSALTAGDEAAINGLVTAVNNLQSHLKSNNFEAP